jgi:hypothetical protein
VNEPLPLEHVLAHVRDTLATDGRVGELGLEVVSEPGSGLDVVVVVRGAVSTHARHEAVAPLATEVLRTYGCEHEVRDDTHVTTAGVPDHEPEQL